MRVCGVIAEYDPFHRGHAYHLEQARAQSQADYIICVMSGSFTQRGMPALLPAHARAEMALRCGADIVLQLPYAFSVREAEYFALGGVQILNALGCVTHLSFGCERDDLSLLQRAALLSEQPDDQYSRILRTGLDRGMSHAEAAGRALAACLDVGPDILKSPNNALAVCYLRALIRLGSPIQPVPVRREYGYHEKEVEFFPSATAVRGAILRGDWPSIEKAVPENALPILKAAVRQGLCPPEKMDSLLRARLLLSAKDSVASLPGMAEGLEMRFIQAAEKALTREEMIAFIKTRRYTQGRISRALCHLMMDVKKSDLPVLPDHARILGFRKEAQPLLHIMQKSDFSLITRPARSASAALDIRADEMRQILSSLPRGETYRQSPVIIP
ncbi:MAG: nucleotidyltransferase family protein [Clostridia bacterium]|nr:nucleotidyltransferase family protein [Clostridia bacterium]